MARAQLLIRCQFLGADRNDLCCGCFESPWMAEANMDRVNQCPIAHQTLDQLACAAVVGVPKSQFLRACEVPRPLAAWRLGHSCPPPSFHVFPSAIRRSFAGRVATRLGPWRGSDGVLVCLLASLSVSCAACPEGVSILRQIMMLGALGRCVNTRRRVARGGNLQGESC